MNDFDSEWSSSWKVVYFRAGVDKNVLSDIAAECTARAEELSRAASWPFKPHYYEQHLEMVKGYTAKHPNEHKMHRDMEVEQIARLWCRFDGARVSTCLMHLSWLLHGTKDGHGCSCSPCQSKKEKSKSS